MNLLFTLVIWSCRLDGEGDCVGDSSRVHSPRSRLTRRLMTSCRKVSCFLTGKSDRSTEVYTLASVRETGSDSMLRDSSLGFGSTFLGVMLTRYQGPAQSSESSRT